MPLSATLLHGSLKSQVEAQVAEPVDFAAAGADQTLRALAAAVVEEVTTNGKAAVTTDSVGVCSNTPMSPGTYTGAGTATSTGSISGLSASRLGGAIRSHLQDLLGDLDFAAGGGDASVDATAEAIVSEISGHARVTATTTDTGTVPSGGGSVNGSGTGVGVVDSLDPDRLHADLKTRIQQKTPDAVLDGIPEQVLAAVCAAVVDHLHAQAQVSVTVDLSVTCPPSGGPGSGSGDGSGLTVS